MARKQHSITFPAFDKVIATAGGFGLMGVGVAYSLKHVAAAGITPEAAAAVAVCLCGAAAPILGERCLKAGQWLKAAGFAVTFALAFAFMVSATVGRTGGAKDAEIAKARADNRNAKAAQEAYDAAKAAATAECMKRGPECRKKEQAVQEAAKALQAAPAEKPEDGQAERIAAALPVTAEQVRLYQPLLLPLFLEVGGFFFLAYGFAPAAKVAEPVAKPKAKAKAKAKPRAKAKAKASVTNGENIIPFGSIAANDR